MQDWRREYVVRGVEQEFTCPECGEPVLDGDRAIDDDKMGQCYCSKRCSTLARARDEAVLGGEG